MKLDIAREKIKEAVAEAATQIEKLGLTSRGRCYYCDRNLDEVAEFNEKVVLLFGEITIGHDELETDDYLRQALCTEIRLGEVNEDELKKDIEQFEADVKDIIAQLQAAEDIAAAIKKITALREIEAEEAIKEFDAEMKHTKLKLYGAMGVLILIILAVLIAGSLIK